MSDNNNTIMITIIPIEEDKILFDRDIENEVIDKNNTRKPEIKGILKNTTTPYNIAKDDKIKSDILELISILVVVIFVSPFVICDLVFGYTDDSCVDIYPENFHVMNMKIYLLVSGYCAIGIISSIFVKWYFVASGDIENNIVLFGLLSVVLHLSQLFLIIWNIMGAVIFWGTLNKRNLCSRSINTYLFVSLIIKLIVNFYNIMSTKNKNN